MTPSEFLFYLMCALLQNVAETNDGKHVVNQERGFLSADVGGVVTLTCFYESDAARYYWYKQPLGQKLQLISISYKFDKDGTFHNEFKDKPRFKLETVIGKSQLQISDLKVSDSGTYFCASGLSFVFEFGEGTTVSVKDSGLDKTALIHQSASESVQPGGSVTLNCSVQTGTCDGEHSVYWFKNAEESHPGLLYSHGGSSDQCERKPNRQTHTCVFNLPMKDLNASHAGTYYCVVASCGQILFGNGTQLDVKSEEASLHLVYFLTGALIFTTSLSVLLVFTLYKMHKRHSCQASEFRVRFSPRQATNGEGNQDPRSLHYSAIGVNIPNRSRSQRTSTQAECVYTSVKL